MRSGQSKLPYWAAAGGIVLLLLLLVAPRVLGYSPLPLTRQWVLCATSLVVFLLACGHAVTGRLAGALIDERKRMSVSRLQTAVWTVIILPAFLVAALANLGTPLTALDIAIPEEVWGLLGISVTSLVGSPLIKNKQRNEPLDGGAAQPERLARIAVANRVVLNGQEIQGTLVANKERKDASGIDLIQGEAVGAQDMLDMGKIQMLFFTIIVALAYAAALHEMFVQAQAGTGRVAAFPDVTPGMLALLGISHAGYLGNKAAASTPAAPPEG